MTDFPDFAGPLKSSRHRRATFEKLEQKGLHSMQEPVPSKTRPLSGLCLLLASLNRAVAFAPLAFRRTLPLSGYSRRGDAVRAQADVATESAVEFKSSFTNLGGVRHHIRDTGESDPNSPVAILMHGFAGSTESWDQVGPFLAAGGCRAIAIDRVGFGRTDRPKVPTLPAPPLLPFREALADSLDSLADESGEEADGIFFALPDPRKALAIGLRNPQTLAPRLPWEFSQLGEDPYSTRFAVERALWDLVRKHIGPSTSGTTRPIYLVGHSAGAPLALQALVEAAGKTKMPPGTALAGACLVAPAALDPREDPDVFERSNGLLEGLPLPEELRRQAEFQLQFSLFSTIVSLPDAVGLQTARRVGEGRDLNEAVRGQVHPRFRAPEFDSRVAELAAKYSEPVRDFPDEWDKALLNVYRASTSDQDNQERLRGRSLLTAAREAKQKIGARIHVVTGDADRVVSTQGSKRVSELLAAERFDELQDTAHLPMDERPNELAALMLDFIADRKDGV